MREPVTEVGKLGPLVARKVDSFSRALISVADLVDRFGGVFFDRGKVYVCTPDGVGPIITCIGHRNEVRLYGFDLEALVKHEHKLQKRGADSAGGFVEECSTSAEDAMPTLAASAFSACASRPECSASPTGMRCRTTVGMPTCES